MNKIKYIKIMDNFFKETKEKAGGKGFRFFHSLQVAKTAVDIALQQGLSEKEQDILFMAGLFHDCGKKNRISKEGYLQASKTEEIELNYARHEDVSADIIRDILKSDFNDEFINIVSITIRDNTNSPLSKILADADTLSEMGCMNIWKMISYSAYSNRNITETIAYWEREDRNRHIEKMQNILFFPESKEIANNRIKVVDQFINHFKEEIGLK